MTTEDWILTTVNYYRQLGFFEEFNHRRASKKHKGGFDLTDKTDNRQLAFFQEVGIIHKEKSSQHSVNSAREFSLWTDNEIIQDIVLRRASNLELEGTPEENLFKGRSDSRIIELDTKRCIHTATDILYGEPGPEYNLRMFVELLKRLSELARGAFNPEEISERDGNKLSFTLNGTVIIVKPKGPPDDPLILAEQINPIISYTGFQFVQWDLEPDVFLMVLTEEENRKLAEEKMWRFRHERSVEYRNLS